jgi:hypothetical protein
MHLSAPCNTLGVIKLLLRWVLGLVWVLTTVVLWVVQVLRRMGVGRFCLGARCD